MKGDDGEDEDDGEGEDDDWVSVGFVESFEMGCEEVSKGD